MAEYAAGEARLKVIPDASEFRKRLDADLAKINRDFALLLQADTSKAVAELDKFRKDQQGNGIGLDVDVKLAGATAHMDAFRARQSKDIDVKVNADTGSALKKLEELSSAADGIVGKLAKGGLFNGLLAGTTELPVAALAATNLAGAIQQLSQAGLVMPGVFAGIASSIGTAKLGFTGMGDAIGQMYKAAQSGDPKDLKKAAEALKDLSPAAVETVTSIGKVLPEFEKLRKDIVQQNMFDGIGKSIEDVSGRLMPTFKTGLGQISTAWNGTFKSLLGAAGSDSSKSFLDKIFGNTAQAQTKANAAIGPFVHAFGQLATTGTAALPRLADGLTKVSGRFDAFINKSATNGNLDKWINDGITAVSRLGDSVLNIGKIFTNLTKAAGGDGGFIKMLDNATKGLANLTGSSAGQAKLRAFFDDARARLRELVPVLKDVGKVLIDAFKGMQQWGEILMPIIGGIAKGLSSMPGLVTGVVTALLGFKSITGIAALAKDITGLGGALKTAGNNAATLGGALGAGGGPATAAARGGRLAALRNGASRVAGGLTSTRGTLGLTGLAVGSSMQIGADTTAGAVGSALGTIASGTLIGTELGGPIGAGIGFVAGGALAAYNEVLRENRRAAEQAADANAKLQQRIAEGTATLEEASAQQKSLNDSLLASGGKIGDDALSNVEAMVGSLPNRFKADFGDKGGQDATSAIKNLGLTEKQLASQIAGDQGLFDALAGRLRGMGPAGANAAKGLTNLRDSLNKAAETGQTAQPLLDTLAAKMNVDLPQAAANIKTAFDAIPRSTPVNVSAPGGQAVLDILTKIGVQVHADNDKNIVVDAPLAPAVLEQLRALGYEVRTNNDKTINITVDQARFDDTMSKLGQVGEAYRALISTSLGMPAPPSNPNTQAADPFAIPPAAPAAPPAQKAAGGPITGGTPGKDSVPLWGMPGEHMFTVDDVNAMGGQAGVYAFRRALHSGRVRGYAPGGAIEPHGLTAGALPGPVALPGADTDAAGGGLFGSFLSDLGGPFGNLGGLFGGGTAAGTAGQDGTRLLPGLAGLMQAGNDPTLMAQWGDQTGDWLGKFAGKTLMSFGSTLWSGLLGTVGLENSILSPNNPWFQSVAKSAGFALGDDGPFATLLGANGGKGGKGKKFDPKKLREAQDKITDLEGRLQSALERQSELKPNAKESQRNSAQRAVDKARRELEEAKADMAVLQSSGGAAGGRGLPAAPTAGQGASRWAPVIMTALQQIGPRYGITNIEGWTNALVGQIGFESKGDPNAYNPKDSDGLPAIGLGQFKAGTFNAHNITGGNINDGVAQIYAMIDYVAKTYGQNASGIPNHINQGRGYAAGGPITGGTPGKDSVPLWGMPGEHMFTVDDVNAMGGQAGVYAFRSALHSGRVRGFEVGGAITGYVPPVIPPKLPEALKKIPRGAQQIPGAPVTQLPAPVDHPGQPAASAAPTAPAEADPARPAQDKYPGLTPVAPPSPSLNHNLSAINTGIASGAATLGNIASTAASAASFGAGGMGAGGGAGALISGLFNEGGKIATGIVNVVSSSLVGNVTTGTTPNAYGELNFARQRVPQTAPDNRTTYNVQAGYKPADIMEAIRLKESQDMQARLAAFS
ncbi:hypothetical protein [Mycolicibacterium mucogenicum]|uniref:Tape measure protein n=1 Tax=Mycolicibacterium mucogenicum DSM 44124 TaxID=1226753 RepID=A0A8H2PI99_MYCMU|nr:hypothetical protein [Mycolicibacterium mucogenicum]KAB7752877.1 hypothetical protein MMUC44124_26445 [Mycolicibacterium mucogenicum DSM 44124]QPG69083.1 hypothetical protein C1S78_027470 [Mycolicibacterium mucogenicum DSM 44124]